MSLQHPRNRGPVIRGPVNPLTLLKQPWSFGEIEIDGLTLANAGTGSITAGEPRKIDMTTGATAGGTASGRTGADAHWFRGQIGAINFSKRILWKVVMRQVSATTNGIMRFTYGKQSADGVAALSRKGIGFQIENLAIKGLSHDGSTLTSTDLSTNLAADQTLAEFLVEADGAGTVRFYVDGVLKGTSTGGPTGTATGDPVVQLEITNGVDNAAQRVIVNQMQYALAQ